VGRHSSSDQRYFYRTFASWIAVWAVVAVVTGTAVWLIVGALSGPAQRPLAADRDRDPDPVPDPTVSGARVAVTPSVPEATPTATPTPTPTPQEIELITEGVSVQVLNATADDAAAQAMADRLDGLGYRIVAIEGSSRPYPKTTVFWSTEESRDAAVALAERHGWVADAKPGNLSDTVSIHVVVGADEA